ncbi:hypothetical protein V8D89_013084 [Ganoderma adspersum]
MASTNPVEDPGADSRCSATVPSRTGGGSGRNEGRRDVFWEILGRPGLCSGGGQIRQGPRRSRRSCRPPEKHWPYARQRTGHPDDAEHLARPRASSLQGTVRPSLSAILKPAGQDRAQGISTPSRSEGRRAPRVQRTERGTSRCPHPPDAKTQQGAAGQGATTAATASHYFSIPPAGCVMAGRQYIFLRATRISGDVPGSRTSTEKPGSGWKQPGATSGLDAFMCRPDAPREQELTTNRIRRAANKPGQCCSRIRVRDSAKRVGAVRRGTGSI